MTKEKFLQAVQSHVARGAIGASTARTNPAGTVEAARAFLRHMPRSTFRVSAARFPSVLNTQTRRLQKALPLRGNSWGLARKMLNIFLRDCLYTTFLHKRFGLQRIEAVLEIPLDGVTAKALRKYERGIAVDPWPNVKDLSPAVSARFQAAALSIAAREGVARVHLDSVFWSLERDAARRSPR